MRIRYAACLLIGLLAAGCQEPASDTTRFHQKMDQVIADMPITFQQLNDTLDNRLRPLAGATEGFQASLTRNVMIEGIRVDVIWTRKRGDTTYIYFEFSGNPCHSPDHMRDKYYAGQTPETALSDGVSNIYHYNKTANTAVGLMTVRRGQQECITNIILRNGKATDPEIPV